MRSGTGGPGTEGPRGPALARLLVRLLTPAEDRELLEADMEERFRTMRRSRGVWSARRWYWWQALRAVPVAFRSHEDTPAIAWRSAGGDWRIAARSLRRRPLYALGVTGTLALGLGSAAAVGSVAWTVWLAPMAFPDPDRVVRLYELRPPEGSPQLHATAGDGAVRWRLSPPLLEDLRSHDWRTLEAVAGVGTRNLDWERDGETRVVQALLASPEIGGILGLRPLVGGLLPDEPEAGTVVLTRGFWEDAFGGDPGVVGRSLTLDGVSHRVAGVVRMPPGYPPEADLLAPMRFEAAQLTEGYRGARYLDAVARVKPAHTVAEARAELDGFVGSLAEAHPQHRGSGGDAVVLADDLMARYTGVLSLLLAAGAAFLVLAVANVAGLVAARRVEGRADRWVRLALGASEGRLLRASLAEGALVGGAAAALGLLAAVWTLSPVRTLLPAGLPRLEELGMDLTLAVAVVGTGLVAGAGVGLLGHLLSRSSTRAGRGPGRLRGGSAPGLAGRRLMVVGQVALTTLLATAGAAVLSHVATLQQVELGFEPDGVLSSNLVLSEARYPSEEERLGVWRGLLDRLEERGFAAAVGVNPPMAGSTMPFGLRTDAEGEQRFAQYHSVSEGYFRLLGIPVVEGRAPGPEDRAGSAPVVVLDETLARQLFPSGGAVGREVTVVAQPRTVVGVVGATRHFGPDAEAPPSMYVPLDQDPWGLGHVFLAGGQPEAAAVLGQLARELDPDLGLEPPAPYLRYLDAWYTPLRLQLVIVGILALVGTALASLGLYALVAYHVTSRRREIGIRMALGAPTRRVFGGVVASGVGLAAVGVALGLAGWYGLLPLTRDLMDGVGSGDPRPPAAVAGLIGVVALVATLVPAWRSTSVDPVTTLAAE